MEIVADDLVGFGGGSGLPAGQEFGTGEGLVVEKAEGTGVRLTVQRGGLSEIDAGLADSWGGASFESTEVYAEVQEPVAERDGRLVTVTRGASLLLSLVAQAIEKGAGGEDDGCAGDEGVRC